MAYNRLFSDSLANKLFQHADRLRIEVHRFEGQLCVNYELRGGISPDIDEDEDGDTLEPVDTRFIRDLLDRFEQEGGAQL